MGKTDDQTDSLEATNIKAGSLYASVDVLVDKLRGAGYTLQKREDITGEYPEAAENGLTVEDIIVVQNGRQEHVTFATPEQTNQPAEVLKVGAIQ